MTLNKSKCKFKQKEIDFLGFKISAEGIGAGEKITAIDKFPVPGDIKAIKSLLGLINQYARFSKNIAEYSAPIRMLLKKDISWSWNEDQQKSFQKIKEEFRSTRILNTFSMDKKTYLTTDASNYGIGAILWQKDLHEEKAIIGAASRSLNETEQRYSTIEKEALGVVWGLEKCHYYICGAPVTVETDHKPLVQLLECKDVEKVPLRIQRFRLKLMKYNVQVVHISGKNNEGADALSWYPVETIQEETLEQETEAFVKQHILKYDDVPRWSYLRKAQEEDRISIMIKEIITNKWEKKETVKELVRYNQNKQYLSLVQGCVMYQIRIIVPEGMKRLVMGEIHNAHQGITRCLARAKESVWWYGIKEEVKKHIRECIQCNIYEYQKVETLEMIPLPKGHWEMVGSDICQLKRKKYILIVDYYSKYIEVSILDKGETSKTIIEKIKSIFSRHGIPDRLISDNGRQYVSEEFKRFAEKYKFQHIT